MVFISYNLFSKSQVSNMIMEYEPLDFLIYNLWQ